LSTSRLDYARSAFELIDEFDGMRTTGQVMSRLGSALSSFGYTAFLITGVPEPPARIEPYVLLNGWPKEFTEHYARENYYADDPVAAWCRRARAPFEWSEARFDPAAWPRAAEVMQVAAEFGMRDGFCVPVGRDNGVQSCVNVAGDRPDFETTAKRAVHLIGLYAHAKALALSRPDGAAQARPRILTDRERETLTWTSMGKSSWEIAMILGVSERTVNWFIANAARKLGAVNRTQAVVNAIRGGEIKI
jgi:LuxR family transcriptional regulator, quorum-sensing system regulator BjaR1